MERERLDEVFKACKDYQDERFKEGLTRLTAPIETVWVEAVEWADSHPVAPRKVDTSYMVGMHAGVNAAIEKACDWIKELCSNCYIMNYTDCCELIDEEIIDWFKRAMKGGEQ